MIEVVVNIVPYGNEKKKHTIGRIEFHNETPKTKDRHSVGDYNVSIQHYDYDFPYDPNSVNMVSISQIGKFKLKNFKRDQGIWKLLEKILIRFNKEYDN